MGVGWEAGALAPPKGACRSTPISCRAATTAAAIVRLGREWLRGCAPHPSLSERRIAYQPRNRCCNVGRIPVQRIMHRSDGLSRRKRPSGRKCVAVWKRRSAPVIFVGGAAMRRGALSLMYTTGRRWADSWKTTRGLRRANRRGATCRRMIVIAGSAWGREAPSSRVPPGPGAK